MQATQITVPDLPVPLTRSVKPVDGRIYILNGTIKSHAKKFSFDFHVDGPDSDIALHIDNRINDKVIVRNNRCEDNWGTEERDGGPLPLASNRPFEMMVLTEKEQFMIAYNGFHYAAFTHRMPLDRIKTLIVKGDIQLNYYREIQSPSVALSRVDLKFATKDQKTTFDLENGIEPDRILHICGIPEAKVYAINFRPKRESKEVGLHISCRLKHDLVVFNSFNGTKWESEIRTKNMRFQQGEHFDLEIVALNNKICVSLFGSQILVFPERHFKPSQLKAVSIEGEVRVVAVSMEPNHFKEP